MCDVGRDVCLRAYRRVSCCLKRAFPKSVAMQYANFMPGEWLPVRDRGYLRMVYERAMGLKVGVGGPDLLPHKPGQMSHCYPLIKQWARRVPTGIAVQDGNYEHQNPKTAQPVTKVEMSRRARGRYRMMRHTDRPMNRATIARTIHSRSAG
jgi:hypothetical protein